jgi:gas vesicle protein
MAQTDTRSLQQIKRETEATRAGLTDTIEQLKTSVTETASDIRHRIRPEVIKAEVSDYIKTRGEQLMSDVTAAARRNPMQAVAVGASVAYPLIRLARAIPMPVLMVGAGLFLAGSKSGQAVTQKASDVAADVSGQVMRQARNLGDQLQESASATNAYAGDQLDRVTAAVSAGREQVKESADDTGAAIASGSKRLRDGVESAGGALSERASGLKNDGLRMAGSAAATVQDLAAGATAAGRSAISNLADSGLDAARAVRHKASDASDRAGQTVLQTIERNSLWWLVSVCWSAV